MRRILFFRLAYFAMPIIFSSAKGQPDHFAYAITAVNKVGTEWVAVRKLDTRTGEFGNILLTLKDDDHSVISSPVNLASGYVNPQTTISSAVAALAYDRKTNRLYYSAMNIDQLRYIDLSSMESFAVSDQFFSKTGKYEFKNAGPINRMVIAPDDYGYTITNDGTHLMRFTTNGPPVLSDLGDLADDPMNKEMTIHSICANSGGDLAADDAGHLYLITGSNKVFKVDIATRISSYLATVSGLPQKFTTSGVAVTENGKQLLVSSSAYSDAYFIIDPETWIATPWQTTNEIYESADLANSNVLLTKNTAQSGLFISKYPENGNRIRIFPNPVLNDEVSIQFNGLPPGNYTIQLVNIYGKKLLQQQTIIIANTQIEPMHIPHHAAQGFYYIHILDAKNNVVSTQKLVVER